MSRSIFCIKRCMKATKILPVPVITGLLFGFSMGLIGPILPCIQKTFFLSSWQKSHLVSFLILGLISGSLLVQPLLKRFDRNQTLKILLVYLSLTAFFGFVAKTYTNLLIYRFLNGSAAGALATLGPMIVVDNAFVTNRARLSFIFQLSIIVGVALSYLLGALVVTNGAFHAIIGFQGLFACMTAFISYFLPKFANPTPPQRLLLTNHKKSFIAACGLNFFQQACGINAITFFIQTLLLKNNQLSVQQLFLLPLVFNFVSFSTTGLVFLKISKLKRKPLLVIGALGMSLAMAMLALNHGHFRTEFFIYLSYMIFFALSFGPLVYLIGNEVFDDRIRAVGASWAFFTNCATNYLISLIFLPLRDIMGPWFMWSLFSIFSALAAYFVWKKVPETKGLTTDEIVKKLNR